LLSFTLAHTLMAPPDQSCLFERRGERWEPAPPTTVATTLNRRFQLDPAVPQYFTLFYALLDAASGLMRIVSAGHPLAVLAPSHGTQRRLPATGPPIGIAEEARFREEVVTLGPGDRLVVFTDGLSEALSPDGGELGVDRVLETVAAYRERPVRECVEALGELGVSWSGGLPHDDISVGAIERTSA
jgi:sigma-B regulation protein RsbU (phosphoserine phosphatase)